MSVFTALSLASLLFFPRFASAKALPCPECEEEPLPVIITTTEPCPHEHGCNHPHKPIPHKPTPPPVIVTEPCHEGCDHPKPPPYTPHVLTSTISTCRKPSSIIPYTSGSTIFLFSSCVPSTLWYTPTPSTMWYTQNETCDVAPPSTVYQSITIPGGTSITTSISTATVYQNGTAPPAQTITLPGSGSVVTITSFQYASTLSPLVITSYESIPESCPAPLTPAAQTMTTTIFESGSVPAAQTVILTSYESGVAPPAQTVTLTSFGPGSSFPAETVVLTSYESGIAPPAQTITLTSYESGVAPPAQTITYTSIGPGSSLPAETVVITSYQSGSAPPAQTITLPPSTNTLTVTSYESGSPPATITLVETTVQGVTSDIFLTSTEISTTTSFTTGEHSFVMPHYCLLTYLVLTTIFETATATQTDLTVSSAPGETVITTLGITYTTQLTAGTSYATETIGTQTIVVRSCFSVVMLSHS